MRQNNDMILALSVSGFAIGLAMFNLFFPWLVSAIILMLGVLIGYGAIRLHFEA